MNEPDILNRKKWIYCKLYRDPSHSQDWKAILDWYHQTLIDIVRPFVLGERNIRVVLFGIYGPMEYNTEHESYYRRIRQSRRSQNNLVYIRARFSMKWGCKGAIKNNLVARIRANTNIVWDYEIMGTYSVQNDLGQRFGSNNDRQTLQFIRYWDAACRYIFSILTLPSNWTPNVDVWAVPHMVNNSLGGWLRPESPPVLCPRCGNHMYLRTYGEISPSLMQVDGFPFCLLECPNCVPPRPQTIRRHRI